MFGVYVPSHLKTGLRYNYKFVMRTCVCVRVMVGSMCVNVPARMRQ